MLDDKEKLEIRLKCKEEKHDKEKKEIEEALERRLEELEDKVKEEKKELEALVSKMRTEVKESSKLDIALNSFNNKTLTNKSLHDIPIVLISAWNPYPLFGPQTIRFAPFLTNYNNGDRPGGGDGVLDLDSGVFTCFTPAYYVHRLLLCIW